MPLARFCISLNPIGALPHLDDPRGGVVEDPVRVHLEALEPFSDLALARALPLAEDVIDSTRPMLGRAQLAQGIHRRLSD